jgi:DNA (cytosine-5)-methyltransferase 1
MSELISCVDLFCGAGGMSFGLKQSGINVCAGVDFDEKCRFSYEENVGAFFKEDVSLITGDWVSSQFASDFSLLSGCVPCQPFSTGTNKNKSGENHKSWGAISQFQRLILESMPDFVVMENVPNIINSPLFKDFIKAINKSRYFITVMPVVYCPSFGIPQSRKRLILFASKHGQISEMSQTHSPPHYVTVRQSIGHLESLSAGCASQTDPMHVCANLSDLNMQRIRASRQGGTWRDWGAELSVGCHTRGSGKSYGAFYGRMEWDSPSPTITTQFTGFGNGRFGHPEQDRAISLREGAILQSFPIDYQFFKAEDRFSISTIARLIGNAVPPLLAKHIGFKIIEHCLNLGN